MYSPVTYLEVRLAFLTARESLRCPVLPLTYPFTDPALRGDVEMKRLVALNLKQRGFLSRQRKRDNEINVFFKNGKSLGDWIVGALGDVAGYFLHLDSGRILFRSEKVPDWIERYSSQVSTLPLMASLLAAQCQADETVSPASIKNIFSGPLLPLPDDFDILRERFAELHMHFANSSHPANIWLQVLMNSEQWLKDIHVCFKKKQQWEQMFSDIAFSDMRRFLLIARVVREWLVCWLQRPDLAYLAESACMIERHCAGHSHILPSEYTAFPLLPWRIHPCELLPGLRHENSIVLEGALWTLALHKLAQSNCRHAARMVHLYHIISSLIVTLSVHQPLNAGFDYFDVLSQSPLRDNLEPKIGEEILRQLIASGNLSKLEARLSCKETHEDLWKRKVRPLLGSYCRLETNGTPRRKIFGRKTPTTRICAAINPHEERELDFGIICHFIKKPNDRERMQRVENRQYFALPRHSMFRDSLCKQMLAFRNLRNSGIGEFLVGIDGAGNEFVAPPEVFSPVYRELQHCYRQPKTICLPSGEKKPLPPLKFTFHVGEDFQHIISGLRAIEEATLFLDLPENSRLGHCVALGLIPEQWVDMNADMLMPALTRLDDVVWLYRFVEDSSHKFIMKKEVADLSQKIYGKGWSTQTLFRAWELRYLPTTYMEKLLPSQRLLHRDYVKSGVMCSPGTTPVSLRYAEIADADIRELLRKYQYGVKASEEGEKLIRVKLDPELRSSHVNAITKAQAHVKNILRKKRIVIETCPSSNIRISEELRLNEHPIFQWRPGADYINNDVSLVIATDNPGFCQTSLPLEYCALKQIAIKKQDSEIGYPVTAREAQIWLDLINEHTHKRSFLVCEP